MGYTLLVGGPVVSTVDTETRFEPSEVVRRSGVHSSVNVVIWTGDEPFGVLEADSREPDVFDEHDVHFLQLYANLVGAAVERQQLSSRTEALSRERELLLNESVHRIKNLLSIVQAIAWRIGKEATSLNEFNQSFSARISALARLQDAMLQEGDRPVSLAELVKTEIGATGAREGVDFVLEGPDVSCNAATARALALLFYELTTNASKYGALSQEAAPGAQINVSWRSEPSGRDPQLEVHWKERASVSKPTHKSGGFGSKLLTDAIPMMLEATVKFSMDDNGVEYVIRFPQRS
jgi:two-component system CheB/CheR fusion protein